MFYWVEMLQRPLTKRILFTRAKIWEKIAITFSEQANFKGSSFNILSRHKKYISKREFIRHVWTHPALEPSQGNAAELPPLDVWFQVWLPSSAEKYVHQRPEEETSKDFQSQDYNSGCWDGVQLWGESISKCWALGECPLYEQEIWKKKNQVISLLMVLKLICYFYK